jgi:hypothetical protein
MSQLTQSLIACEIFHKGWLLASFPLKKIQSIVGLSKLYCGERMVTLPHGL